MRARFVLDESSWDGATKDSQPGVLSNAIERLLERLDVARVRGERVVKHADFYWTDLGGGLQLFSLLFVRDCPIHLDPDLASQLSMALDRAEDFDDSTLVAYEATTDAEVRFAPGLVWAHTSCRDGHQVAVLPLCLGRVPAGRVPVTVADSTLEIYFVTRESQHVNFFRSVISLEKANEAMFQCLATSAFPALAWADKVWRGLGAFSRPYIEVRDELVRCLGGLSDHGALCFFQHQADPRELARVLSARIGVPISDENGATKRYPPSRRDRTRFHRGRKKVFWWHIKLRPNVDRIHFLYESPEASVDGSEKGQIIVGLFKDHCVLMS